MFRMLTRSESMVVVNVMLLEQNLDSNEHVDYLGLYELSENENLGVSQMYHECHEESKTWKEMFTELRNRHS